MNFKNTLLPIQTTLQSKGRLLSLARPVVMGILNATPDSFYNQGRDSDMDGLLRSAERMLRDGATILDVGGATTRPGAALMPAAEEADRVVPVVQAIRRRFPDAWLSVDTYNAPVAEAAVAAGADIVNDVSSGRFDAQMLHTVARLQVPYIAMHMQGTPQTMQAHPQYDSVVDDVLAYLAQVVQQCAHSGIRDVIIDPGFGFGKSVEHNFSLLRNLHVFRSLGKPVLAGLSRKSMVCRPLHVNPDQALNGTTALHMVALQQGAGILRAHDVKEAMQVIELYHQLYGYDS